MRMGLYTEIWSGGGRFRGHERRFVEKPASLIKPFVLLYETS